jgi:hypothetical protein
LLDRAEFLRRGIDWRRGELVKGKPGIDRVELATKIALMETDLARIERLITARGRAVMLELNRAAKGERPMATLQSMTARPAAFALPQLSSSLDARAIQVPPEGDTALELASQALGRAQKAGNDMLATCAAILQNEVLTMPARHVEMSKARKSASPA